MKLRKRYLSLCSSFEKGIYYLKRNEIEKNQFEIDGVINFLWQAWNVYWRQYWISKYVGYYDIKNNYISRNGILFSNNENEIVFNILYQIGKRRNPVGFISGSHQEPTWGSSNMITEIAIALNDVKVFSTIGLYTQSIEHFQITRNSTIHLNKDTMNNLRLRVLPYYSLSSIKRPTEVLYSTPLAGRNKTYNKWSNDLLGFIINTN